MIGFLAGVLLVAAPVFVPIYHFEFVTTQGKTVILAPIFLFGVFTVCLPVWASKLHHLQRPWQALGMAGGQQWWRHWALAFGIGALGVGILYGIQLGLGWAVWLPPTVGQLLRNALEGFFVGFGVGVAEELIFRGWVLFELEQDYSRSLALWLNAVIFAIAHYTHPLSVILDTWPQFFGLVLLGLTLVWARRLPLRSGASGAAKTHLGFAAGLHGGLVWAYYQVDVGDLVLASGQVSPLITGVGGNPLAGGLGLGLLGAIAIGTYVASHRTQSNHSLPL